MTYVNDADLSDWDDWDTEQIYQIEDFFDRMMRELGRDRDESSLWHEWISDGASLHDESYTDKPYTREEEQKAKVLAGPYGRVIILAWLQSRKSDNE